MLQENKAGYFIEIKAQEGHNKMLKEKNTHIHPGTIVSREKFFNHFDEIWSVNLMDVSDF